MTIPNAAIFAPGRARAVKAQLQRASWGMMLFFLAHGLIVSSWVSRIASIKSALHLNDGALGLALLGTAIGSIAAVPASGMLVNRYGSRRTAKWTSVGFCSALALPALSKDGVSLFAALLVFGAMAGANDVAINAQAVGTEEMLGVLNMSRFHAMFSVGGIAGAGLGGLFAAWGVSPLTHLASASAVLLILANLAPRFTVETRTSGAPPARMSLRQVPTARLGFAFSYRKARLRTGPVSI
jgi:MFS family permease